jgi:hypothetical protein
MVGLGMMGLGVLCPKYGNSDTGQVNKTGHFSGDRAHTIMKSEIERGRRFSGYATHLSPFLFAPIFFRFPLAASPGRALDDPLQLSKKDPVLLEYAKASFERIKQRLRHL